MKTKDRVSVGYFGEHSFSSYEDFFESFVRKIEKTKRKLEKEGWANINIEFSPRMEPYEDFAGPTEVYVVGERQATAEEIKREREKKRIIERSKKLGITPYEVVQLENLEKKGVVR